MATHSEPKITINGLRLSEAQAMALRVALTDFSAQLDDPDVREGLGLMADAYKARIDEILRLILGCA